MNFHIKDIPDVFSIDLIAEKLVEVPETIINLDSRTITASESFDLIKYYSDELIIIDLREAELFKQGSIDKAINLSKKTLIKQADTKLDKSKHYLIFGDKLTENELSKISKHSNKYYYMKSSLDEWYLAAMRYYERVIK